MKHLVCLVIVSLFSFSVMAQEVDTLLDMGHPWPDNDIEMLDGCEVYVIVDKMPEYPGGIKQLEGFIQNHISDSLRKEDARVFVRCVIDTTGRLRTPVVLAVTEKQKKELYQQDALRITRLMPKWNPAEQYGEKKYIVKVIMFDYSPIRKE